MPVAPSVLGSDQRTRYGVWRSSWASTCGVSPATMRLSMAPVGPARSTNWTEATTSATAATASAPAAAGRRQRSGSGWARTSERIDAAITVPVMNHTQRTVYSR